MQGSTEGVKKVLSYHGVTLRACDIDTLKDRGWLNDQMIDFYWEYLRKEKYFGQEKMHLVDASVSFFFVQAGEQDLRTLMESSQLGSKDCILFPVNNNTDITTAYGGTHWSLLVYTKEDHCFRHYNSMKGSNVKAANAIQAAASGILEGRPISAYQYLLDPLRKALCRAPDIITPTCPQQENGHDCGLYVLEFADRVCQNWTDQGGRAKGQTLLEEDLLFVSRHEIHDRRKKLRELVHHKISAGSQV